MTLSYSVLLAVSMMTGSFLVRGLSRSFFKTLMPSSSGSMISSSTSEGTDSSIPAQNAEGRSNPRASMP